MPAKQRSVQALTLIPSAVEEPASPLANSRGLSLRHLRRISSRMTDGLKDVGLQVSRAILMKFLPRDVAWAVEGLMHQTELPLPPSTADFFDMDVPEIVSSPTSLQIGDTTMDVPEPEFPELIPKTLFYENALHSHILREMLRDMEVFDERAILLMGNQGVGKNKLADKLLMLMRREREYLQLHRDTTVQSLTTSPSLEGGVVQWNDSPLVRAVRNGYVLVVDEADKAPVEVVTILKSLIEDAEMVLSDGKKIVPPGSPEVALAATTHPLVANPDVIEMHPRFRMIVLANRPGYPFLGNDFFREIGDVLSCHIIDNPDKESELQLLRSYGPDVPDAILEKLADAFDELRRSNEEGLLAYPYSTRELVAIVKHLQAWPDDGLLYTLDNVLSFDKFDDELMQSLDEIFQSHDITIGPVRRWLAPDALTSRCSLGSLVGCSVCRRKASRRTAVPIRRRQSQSRRRRRPAPSCSLARARRQNRHIRIWYPTTQLARLLVSARRPAHLEPVLPHVRPELLLVNAPGAVGIEPLPRLLEHRLGHGAVAVAQLAQLLQHERDLGAVEGAGAVRVEPQPDRRDVVVRQQRRLEAQKERRVAPLRLRLRRRLVLRQVLLLQVLLALHLDQPAHHPIERKRLVPRARHVACVEDLCRHALRAED